jgi:hypothetical protein
MDHIGQTCVGLFLSTEAAGVDRWHMNTECNRGVERVFVGKNLFVANTQVAVPEVECSPVDRLIVTLTTASNRVSLLHAT